MLDAAANAGLAYTHPSHAGCGRYWAAVQTHPQAERWCHSNLLRQGYNSYLPLCVVQRPDRATPTLRHNVEAPLFPGYLFVQIDDRDPWTPIRYSQGVLRLLMSGGKPHHVFAGAVEALQSGEALRRCHTPQEGVWRPGAACSVSHGAFQDHPAVVIGVNRSVATVALLLFGELRHVQVETSCLKLRE
jgi:transcription antitermination factor NusG